MRVAITASKENVMLFQIHEKIYLLMFDVLFWIYNFQMAWKTLTKIISVDMYRPAVNFVPLNMACCSCLHMFHVHYHTWIVNINFHNVQLSHSRYLFGGKDTFLAKMVWKGPTEICNARLKRQHHIMGMQSKYWFFQLSCSLLTFSMLCSMYTFAVHLCHEYFCSSWWACL